MSTPYEDILFLEEHWHWPGDMNRFPDWVEELRKTPAHSIAIVEHAKIHAFRGEIERLRSINAKLLEELEAGRNGIEFSETLRVAALLLDCDGHVGVANWLFAKADSIEDVVRKATGGGQ